VPIIEKQITYYGCLTDIPLVKYQTESLDGCTLVKIYKDSGNNFEKDHIYAFRLGFFLKWPKELVQINSKKWIRQFISGGMNFNYTVHTLDCPLAAENELNKRADIRERLNLSCLYIDLAPFILRYKEENPGNDIVESGLIDKWSDVATSDLWIVVNTTDKVDTMTELMAGNIRMESPVKYGLFTHTGDAKLLPYKEWHIKYKENIRPLTGTKYVTAIEDICKKFPTTWNIDMAVFNLRSWMVDVLKYAGVLAVLLAIGLAITTPIGYQWHLLSILPAIYLLLLLISNLIRYKR